MALHAPGTSHGPPDDPTSRVRDPARLAALHATGLLDTPPEQVFDRLTALAATVLGVPSSFISLVDRDRDFYKSQFGLPDPLPAERQLEGTTFCHYTLGSPEPLALDNVEGLPVFQDLPTVTRFGIRAYLGVPIRTADGKNIGSICAVDVRPHAWSSQDIQVLTELAASAMREIELRAALHALQTADARKDIFLATMAHELRQPLAALMPAVVVMERMPDADTMQRAREIVARQVRQLQRVVDDLSDIAGVAGGKIALTRVRADVAGIVTDAVESMTPLAAQRGQTLRVVAPPAPVWREVDTARLHQVFSNLITNATKYTQDGGDITVTLAECDAVLQVSVRDNGQGMEPDALPQVFDLYMQEGTEQRAGLGIGLHLVRRLVELHGGTVEARSDGRGLGSEFVVTLPA